MVQNMKTVSSYPLHHFLFMVNSGAQTVSSKLLLTARKSRVPWPLWLVGAVTPLVDSQRVYQLQPLPFPLQPLHRPVPKPLPAAFQANCRADVSDVNNSVISFLRLRHHSLSELNRNLVVCMNLHVLMCNTFILTNTVAAHKNLRPVQTQLSHLWVVRLARRRRSRILFPSSGCTECFWQSSSPREACCVRSAERPVQFSSKNYCKDHTKDFVKGIRWYISMLCPYTYLFMYWMCRLT